MSKQRTITLVHTLCLLIFANIQVSQATEKTTPIPGEIRVEFTSQDEINLYAFKAKRIEILNQLSKYITLELIVDSQLNEQTTIEINNQSLAQVLIHLLGDHNHIVWYRSNSIKQRQTSTLRLHETKSRSKIKNIKYVDSNIPNSIEKQLATTSKNTIELIENYGDLKSVDSIKWLEKMISHANTEQKLEICSSLGDIGTTRAVSLLEILILDNNPMVRQEAVYALGDISADQAVKVLTLAINDSVFDIQLLAISELALIDSESSVRALDIALKDQNPHIRLTAAQALGEQTSAQSTELLWTLTQSDELPIAMAANEILTRLNQQ